MTAYVEECRQEWKRLGVPDLLAEEMATELESDLAEAQADGVSTAEILGESDPRRFAATWASERGLVAEPAPPPRKRRRWLWVLVGLVVVVLLAWIATVIGLFAAASVSVQTSVRSPVQPVTVPAVLVPNLVGMKASRALSFARGRGLDPVVTSVSPHPGDVVIAQTPAAGARIRRGATVVIRVGRR
jgi:PASTA domain